MAYIKVCITYFKTRKISSPQSIYPCFIEQIMFFDEAAFWLNSSVNSENCRYWSGDNAYWMIDINTLRKLMFGQE